MLKQLSLTGGHPIHPACEKWPWPSDAEFNKLVDDIRANGLINDIWITGDGAILDGKVREKACSAAGVEPRFQTYQGDDPIGFSISQNASRRHMPRHELAFLVEELATLSQGRPTKTLSGKGLRDNKTTTHVAEMAGISVSLVENARAVRRYGAPNIIELAKTGRVGLRPAAAFVRHTSKEEQEQAVAGTIVRKGNAISERSKATYAKDAASSKDIKHPQDRTVTVVEVIDALRPLVKRIKEQSRQHPAMVSQASLAIIASAFEMIFKAWAQGDAAGVARITRHVAGSYIRDGSSEANGEYYYNNQEAQQRDPGSDPGPRH